MMVMVLRRFYPKFCPTPYAFRDILCAFRTNQTPPFAQPLHPILFLSFLTRPVETTFPTSGKTQFTQSKPLFPLVGKLLSHDDKPCKGAEILLSRTYGTLYTPCSITGVLPLPKFYRPYRARPHSEAKNIGAFCKMQYHCQNS